LQNLFFATLSTKQKEENQSKKSITSKKKNPNQKKNMETIKILPNMTVSQHLLELRNRLGKILIPLIGIFFLLFFISEFIIDGIINFVGISDIIVTLTPFEYMSTKL